MKNETKAILTFAKNFKDWPPKARKKAAKAVKENRVSARSCYVWNGGVADLIFEDIKNEIMGT
jgi:hypothetical protein